MKQCRHNDHMLCLLKRKVSFLWPWLIRIRSNPITLPQSYFPPDPTERDLFNVAITLFAITIFYYWVDQQSSYKLDNAINWQRKLGKQIENNRYWKMNKNTSTHLQGWWLHRKQVWEETVKFPLLHLSRLLLTRPPRWLISSCHFLVGRKNHPSLLILSQVTI